MAKHTETAGTSPPIATFSKEQLLKSQRYHERRDLLYALLKDNKRYTHAEIETLIGDFMKGKVK
jgi:hypothetical protein